MERYNLRTSPFLDFQSPFTVWEALKMIILLPLVPIRVALIFLVIGLVAVINSLATLGWPEGRPLSVLRRSIVELGSNLCVIIFFAMGFHVRVTGRENVKKAKELKAVGIFNHVSYVDTLLLFWLFLPSGVSKRGNSRIPVVKNCIRCLNNIWVDETKRDRLSNKKIKTSTGQPNSIHPGSKPAPEPEGSTPPAFQDISNTPTRSPASLDGSKHPTNSPVDQSNVTQAGAHYPTETSSPTVPLLPSHSQDLTVPATAKTVTALITERVMDPLYCVPGGFPLLFIAPEGTVSNGQCLIKFRSGAFITGRPVLPVLLKYPFKHLNAAYTEMDVPFHLLRMMCQWVNHLEVTILPPYVPSPEEVADPTLYANNVRQHMADKLKVPLVEQEYAHCSAMRKKNIWVARDGKKVVGPKDEIDEDLNIMLDLSAQKRG